MYNFFKTFAKFSNFFKILSTFFEKIIYFKKNFQRMLKTSLNFLRTFLKCNQQFTKMIILLLFTITSFCTQYGGWSYPGVLGSLVSPILKLGTHLSMHRSTPHHTALNCLGVPVWTAQMTLDVHCEHAHTLCRPNPIAVHSSK